MPCHPDRVRRNYEEGEFVSKEDLAIRIVKALKVMDYYSEQCAYGDAVLFAKAALLGVSVDECC